MRRPPLIQGRPGLARSDRPSHFGAIAAPQASPPNMPHMLMRTRLAHWLRTRAANGLDVIENATVDLGAKMFLEADIVVAKVPKGPKRFRVKDLSLAVEIADTSRGRDLFTKAPRYGAAGVPELWVVELNESLTYVFRGPGSEAWTNPARVPFDSGLEALFLPGQCVRLAEFQT